MDQTTDCHAGLVYIDMFINVCVGGNIDVCVGPGEGRDTRNIIYWWGVPWHTKTWGAVYQKRGTKVQVQSKKGGLRCGAQQNGGSWNCKKRGS